MWLAMLIVCSTPDVQSCTIVAQTDSLYATEATCLSNAQQGIMYFSSNSFHVNGGCVKIGESV